MWPSDPAKRGAEDRWVLAGVESNLKRLRTTILLSTCLACITVTLVFAAIGIGLVPSPHKPSLDARAKLCESLAVQLSMEVQERQIDLFMALAPAIEHMNQDILSLGLRRSDGHLLAATDNHKSLWKDAPENQSTATHIRVPILHGDQKFGEIEICFTPILPEGIRGFLCQLRLPLVLFMAVSGFVAYLLYLGRALRMLDPSSVIPDRVRAALDTLSESVVMTDNQERIVLANEAFARISGRPTSSLLGLNLSLLPWIKRRSEKEHSDLPWIETLREGFARKGVPLVLETQSGESLSSIVNAAPITGPDGKSRGVITSFTDVSELENRNKELIDLSRLAGMAEVASEVLHNVGNVLNSVNVSATSIVQNLSNSQLSRVKQVTEMIAEHIDDVGTFFTEDTRGKHIPTYLVKAADLLVNEQVELLDKIQSITDDIDHIKEIVRMQQSHARTSGLKTETLVTEVLEDAIRLNDSHLRRHKIKVVREFEEIGLVHIDKSRVLQIVTNLIRNASEALVAGNDAERLLKVRCCRHEQSLLRIEVVDNGIGISPENLTKIFGYGFTTREKGHGFGLHSSAIAASDMGGRLSGHSEGLGHGAIFVLELPIEQERTENETRKTLSLGTAAKT